MPYPTNEFTFMKYIYSLSPIGLVRVIRPINGPNYRLLVELNTCSKKTRIDMEEYVYHCNSQGEFYIWICRGDLFGDRTYQKILWSEFVDNFRFRDVVDTGFRGGGVLVFVEICLLGLVYKLTNCKGLDCQFILGLSRMLFVDSTHLLELFVNKIYRNNGLLRVAYFMQCNFICRSF